MAADPLSPSVEALVAAVRSRVLTAATPAEIRALADEAGERARNDVTTQHEIRSLMDIALDRAQQIAGLMGRLADLTGEGG